MNATSKSQRSQSIPQELVTPGSAPDPFWAPVIVRLATGSDRRSLEVLAELDSSPDPVQAGEAVIGELQGRVVAAVSLRDGRTMADPFVAAEEIVSLVRLRAEQLVHKARPQGPRARSYRR